MSIRRSMASYMTSVASTTGLAAARMRGPWERKICSMQTKMEVSNTSNASDENERRKLTKAANMPVAPNPVKNSFKGWSHCLFQFVPAAYARAIPKPRQKMIAKMTLQCNWNNEWQRLEVLNAVME